MLEAPSARQTRTGEVSVGEAHLTCGEAAAWIYAHPDSNRWIAGYHGPQVAPLRLEVPDGTVEIEAMGTGTIVWDAGNVRINAIDITGTPLITGGQLVESDA
jgi:hypothetical protein